MKHKDKNKSISSDNTQKHQELALVKIDNTKWYKKIWNIIKKILVNR